MVDLFSVGGALGWTVAGTCSEATGDTPSADKGTCAGVEALVSNVVVPFRSPGGEAGLQFCLGEIGERLGCLDLWLGWSRLNTSSAVSEEPRFSNLSLTIWLTEGSVTLPVLTLPP